VSWGVRDGLELGGELVAADFVVAHDSRDLTRYPSVTLTRETYRAVR
jgi:hypothetical protein